MKKFTYHNNAEKYLAAVSVCLLVLSLVINLGSYPLFLEEPRRALIALEMLFTDNYVVPTELGAYYYKKPPIWNWIIIFGFKLFDSYSEFSVRFFGIISFLAIGGAVYFFAKRYLDNKVAFYSMILFMTTADSLFYITAVPGEIDLFYSLTILLLFFAAFYFYQKESFLYLFLSTYFLASIGFLTKGIPSFAFLGITLLVLFIDGRNFKKLISIQHFLGFALMLLIVGGYFYLYSKSNDVMTYFFTAEGSLFAQSANKSFLGHELPKIIVHFLKFPFEVIMRMLPVSFFVLLIVKERVWKLWMKQPFLRYLMWAVIANIVIYWLSPDSRSRYLYMFYPCIAILLTYSYFYQKREEGWFEKLWDAFSWILIVVIFTAFASLPFLRISGLPETSVRIIVSVVGSIAVIALSYFRIRQPNLKLITLVLVMIFARVYFALVILEVRASDSPMQERKQVGQHIGMLAKGQKVYYHSDLHIMRQVIFYVEQQTGKIVELTDQIEDSGLYLVNPSTLKKLKNYQIMYEISFESHDLALIDFKNAK